MLKDAREECEALQAREKCLAEVCGVTWYGMFVCRVFCPCGPVLFPRGQCLLNGLAAVLSGCHVMAMLLCMMVAVVVVVWCVGVPWGLLDLILAVRVS